MIPFKFKLVRFGLKCFVCEVTNILHSIQFRLQCILKHFSLISFINIFIFDPIPVHAGLTQGNEDTFGNHSRLSGGEMCTWFMCF